MKTNKKEENNEKRQIHKMKRMCVSLGEKKEQSAHILIER